MSQIRIRTQKAVRVYETKRTLSWLPGRLESIRQSVRPMIEEVLRGHPTGIKVK